MQGVAASPKVNWCQVVPQVLKAASAISRSKYQFLECFKAIVFTLPCLVNAGQVRVLWLEVSNMATVKITKNDGQVIEVSDLSFEQVKEIVGLNGQAPARIAPQRGASLNPRDFGPDYEGFKKNLTEKAKKFFQLLRENPNGISADHLAGKLGFTNSSQIGGMTGGGIGKIAPKHGIRPEWLYIVNVKRENGVRVVTYRPGKEIGLVS
jgi:hypothetical protein